MSYETKACPTCGKQSKIDTVTFKLSKTTKDYPVKYHGYSFTVPAGSVVSNRTACGNDDSYHFWQNWNQHTEKITGFKDSTLNHDLTYYGLNIPTEYCEAYDGD